jgi:hypothetical protein
MDKGFFIDDKAEEQQREALQIIFGGKAGGFIPRSILFMWSSFS